MDDYQTKPFSKHKNLIRVIKMIPSLVEYFRF